MKTPSFAPSFLVLTACAALVGCATSSDRATSVSRTPAVAPAVLEAGELMVGRYDSSRQAIADPDFRDVRLAMIRIWPERTDAFWIYVEQAMASSPARPYRQRIYAVRTEADDRVTSHVYELPGDPLLYAGAQDDPSRLAPLTPESLELREGCAVHLTRADGGWTGATLPNACLSSHMGAAYATSEVTVTREALTSWDRGYDAGGRQVWGATKGPYVFLRRE